MNWHDGRAGREGRGPFRYSDRVRAPRPSRELELASSRSAAAPAARGKLAPALLRRRRAGRRRVHHARARHQRLPGATTWSHVSGTRPRADVDLAEGGRHNCQRQKIETHRRRFAVDAMRSACFRPPARGPGEFKTARRAENHNIFGCQCHKPIYL